MPWTHRDFAEMHYHYGLNDGDAAGAAESFRNQYIFSRKYGGTSPNRNYTPEDEPDRIFPTGVDILRIHKLYQNGELPDENTITGKRKEGEKIKFFQSSELRRKVDPFKEARLKASKELLEKCKDENFFDQVLWTGIAEVSSNCFAALGYEKMHESDHDNGEDHLVYVWVGMLAGEVIGPFEMPDEITDEIYAKFLKDDLPGLLEDVPVDVVKDKMYIHVEDKYVGDRVKTYLNENYKDRWIGPGGSINWPIIAWDLNPVRYIWGSVINHVYKDKCDSKQEIMERVVIGCDAFEQHEREGKKDKEWGNIKSTFLKLWNECVKENGADVSGSWRLI